MNAYELMIAIGRYLIKDGQLIPQQEEQIFSRLMSAKNGPGTPRLDKEGREMYPRFFIPEEPDCKKLRTLFNQIPKTKIFAHNMYELEILRLLHLLRPEHSEVREMVSSTLERLRNTCFGYQDDGVGECFDASLAVLRFLAAAAPEERGWIKSRMDNFNRHYPEKKRPWYCLWYYWLCLSELPEDIAQPEVDKYRELMLSWLGHKGFVMHSEHDTAVHPVLAYMLRDNLARYPEYAHIRGRAPYIAGKDGRLRFPMELAAG